MNTPPFYPFFKFLYRVEQYKRFERMRKTNAEIHNLFNYIQTMELKYFYPYYKYQKKGWELLLESKDVEAVTCENGNIEGYKLADKLKDYIIRKKYPIFTVLFRLTILCVLLTIPLVFITSAITLYEKILKMP